MKSRRPKPSEIKRFKTALLDKRGELLRTVVEMESESLRTERADAPRVPNHPAEVGTDSYELENTTQLLETETRILEDVDRALELIEKGLYGRCEVCHNTIPLKRLNAIPWARLCLACANAFEQGQPTPKRMTRLSRRHVC